MKKTPKTLRILTNGISLGVLERPNLSSMRFSYEKKWIENHPTLPISRQLPVQEDPYTGAAVEAYFENLLPDNEDIRGKIAAKFGLSDLSTFAILSKIGKDCVGALQLLPIDEEPVEDEVINGRELSEAEVARLLRNLRSHPMIGDFEEDDFRISIAGAQEKTALLRIGNKWFLPRGMTPTTHIFKPSIGATRKIDLSLSVENEWLCLKLCEVFGLTVNHAEIVDFEDQRTLVIERFDRVIIGTPAKPKRILRLFQEDLCQATGTPSHLKYENATGNIRGPGIVSILKILSESTRPDTDRRSFLRAQLIFWLIGATDGHGKHFSLHGREEGFNLTPIYDVLSAEPLVATKQLESPRLKLAMGVGKKKHYRLKEIMPRHWKESAIQAKFDPAEVDHLISDLIRRVPEGISKMEKLLPPGFPASVSDSIFEAARRRVKIFSSGKG